MEKRFKLHKIQAFSWFFIVINTSIFLLYAYQRSGLNTLTSTTKSESAKATFPK